MEWVLRSPQIHSIFSNLGYVHGDGYHVNENCNGEFIRYKETIPCILRIDCRYHNIIIITNRVNVLGMMSSTSLLTWGC